MRSERLVNIEESVIHPGHSYVVPIGSVEPRDKNRRYGYHVPRDWARMYRDELSRLTLEREGGTSPK